jgi:hypothetical protein
MNSGATLIIAFFLIGAAFAFFSVAHVYEGLPQ